MLLGLSAKPPLFLMPQTAHNAQEFQQRRNVLLVDTTNTRILCFQIIVLNESHGHKQLTNKEEETGF